MVAQVPYHPARLGRFQNRFGKRCAKSLQGPARCPADRSTLKLLKTAPESNQTTKAPGGDGHPGEFCKYGPTALMPLYWKVNNKCMRGEAPTVCPHEWAGVLASYAPKNLSALQGPEFRPIACICTKCVFVLSINSQRMNQTAEDLQLVYDAQEAFRRNKSTERQLGKLRSLLMEQRVNLKGPHTKKSGRFRGRAGRLSSGPAGRPTGKPAMP
jgi:hypothetical protein